MKKLFLDIRKHPMSYVITSVISLAVGFLFFCIFYFWLGQSSLVGALNGTGVAGAVLIAVFGLAWLSRNGAFDTISYGFNQMFASMFNKEANRYNDMVEYKEEKNKKREVSGLYYFAFLFVGILYLFAFAGLEIYFHVLY